MNHARPPAPEALSPPAIPFPGLRSFSEQEYQIFFGRDQHVNALLHRLHASRFLAVVGPSGSGKSSLVKAGLLPALEAGFLGAAGPCWDVVPMRPTTQPIDMLASQLATHLTGLPIDGLTPGEASDLLAARLRQSPRALGELLRLRSPVLEAGSQDRSGPPAKVMILVDQFEELFRYARSSGVASAGEAASFVSLLLHASGQLRLPDFRPTAEACDQEVYVVLTMRADYLGDCVTLHGLAEAVSRHQYLPPRLSRTQCREAIVGPVQVGGGRIDERLVNRILNDLNEREYALSALGGPAALSDDGDDLSDGSPVGAHADGLPLLQHVLRRTWETASRRPESPDYAFELLESDYEAVGGLAEALNTHAEECLEEYTQSRPDHGKRPDPKASEARLALAARLSRSLIDRRANRGDSRRPADLATIAAETGYPEAELLRAVAPFSAEGRHFIVQSAADKDGSVVLDIGHESLIRQWHRLDRWADDEAEAAAQLRETARRAKRLADDRRYTLQGLDLQNAERWLDEVRPTKRWVARYEAAPAATLKRVRRLIEKSQRAKKWRRMPLILVVGLIIVSAFAIGGRIHIADLLSKRLKVLSKLDLDYVSSLRLAADIAAERRQADDEQRHLLTVLERAPTLETVLRTTGAMVYDVTVGPQAGQWVTATAGTKGQLQLWRCALADDGARSDSTPDLPPAVPEVLDEAEDGFSQVALHPTRPLLAASLDNNGDVRLYEDRPTGWSRSTWVLVGTGSDVHELKFSPSGDRLVAATGEGLLMWRVPPGDDLLSKDWQRLRVPAELRKCRALSLAMCRDRPELTVGDNATKALRTWNWQTDALAKCDIKTAPWALTYEPGGQRLAASDNEQSLIHLLRLPLLPGDSTLSDSALLVGHSQYVTSLAYSPDGRLLASSSADGSVRLWDPLTATQVGTPLKGSGSYVNSIAFSRDGSWLASCDDGGQVCVWSLRDRRRVAAGGTVLSLAALADQALAVGVDGVGLVRWDLDPETGRLRQTLRGAVSADALSLRAVADAGDHRVLAAGVAGELYRWDGNAASMTPVGQTAGKCRVTRIATSIATGRTIIGRDSTGQPPFALLSSDGTMLGEWGDATDTAYGAAFSKDGTLVALACQSGRVEVCDGATLTPLRSWPHDRKQPSSACAWLGNSHLLVLGGTAGSLRLWDLTNPAAPELIDGPVQNQAHMVNCLAVSDDGRLLAAGSRDCTVRLWTVDGSRHLQPLTMPMTSHREDVTAVVFLGDRHWMAFR